MLEPPYQMFRQALDVTDNFLDVLIFINKLRLLFLLNHALRLSFLVLEVETRAQVNSINFLVQGFLQTCRVDCQNQSLLRDRIVNKLFYL